MPGRFLAVQMIEAAHAKALSLRGIADLGRQVSPCGAHGPLKQHIERCCTSYINDCRETPGQTVRDSRAGAGSYAALCERARVMNGGCTGSTQPE